MCQEARSPSSADRVWLVQASWARAHRWEKELLKGSSQIYDFFLVKNQSASTTKVTYPPSKRPYEFAGDTMQSNRLFGGLRSASWDWMIVTLF